MSRLSFFSASFCRYSLLTALFILPLAPAPLFADEIKAETALPPAAMVDTIRALLAPEEPEIEGYDLTVTDVKAFYEARGYQPVWDLGEVGKRENVTKFVLSVADFASAQGLEVNPYPSALMKKLAASTSPADGPKLEILLTDWLLRLSYDLAGDSIDLGQVYSGWTFQRPQTDILTDFTSAVIDNKVQEFIGSLVPTQSAYLYLQKQLRHYRELAQTKGKDWKKITEGPTLVPGDQGERVLQLRARLAVEGYLPEREEFLKNPLFDKPLEEALQTYQARNGLKKDGHVGGKTLTALNVPLEARIEQIIANMERWRHMPQIFPERSVRVNIPDYSVELFDEGKSIYRGPVMVGRPDRKTPFIQSAIRSVIFNPSWHVPATIARKDILPKLRRDPHYLEKMGLVINGSADDPHGEAIDWSKIRASAFNFRLRQVPGEGNSLGRLKFDFDNDFSVYMHGTPHQDLFAKDVRTLSSGCVRLRDPEVIAQLVLQKNEGNWNAEHIREAIDQSKTRWMKLAEPLPIYILYWTAFEGEDGTLQFRADPYGYDRFLIDALKERDNPEAPTSRPTGPAEASSAPKAGE